MVSARLALLAVAASSLFSGAFARPHVRHMNKHVVRDTVVEYVPARVEKHVVCDQFGNTLAVSYTTVYPDARSTSVSKRKKKGRKTTTTSVVEAAPTNYNPAPVPEPVPATTTSAAAPPAQSSTYAEPPNSDPATLGKGLVFSPYKWDHQCKSFDETQNEMKIAFQNGDGYKWVRIYGADCNQVYNVLKAAYSLNLKVMLGFYNIWDGAQLQEAISTAIADVKKAAKENGKENDAWSIISLVAAGNEVINGGLASIETLNGAVGTVRAALRAEGYKGSVGTADVWWRYRELPALCGEDEIVPINLHPFFDLNCAVENSGAFLKSKLQEIQDVCGPNKKVVIVETGWPSAGNKFGQAQPGKAEQQTFLQQAAANLDSYIVISAFNENWKTENTDAHVERFWGVYGNSPSDSGYRGA